MNVTRRTVLKAIGATLFAPCVTLRREIDREALMMLFCGSYYRSYRLDSPFSVGSLTYATDARHIVRAELVNRHEDGERKIPDVERCWKQYWRPGRMRPLEIPPLSQLIDGGADGLCPACGGRRVSFGEHYPTNEQLESTWVYKVGYDIDDNTIRDPSCSLCHGREWTRPSVAVIGGHKFLAGRLLPIAALPNVRASVYKDYYKDGMQGGVMCFVADGFEGMAIGLSE